MVFFLNKDLKCIEFKALVIVLTLSLYLSSSNDLWTSAAVLNVPSMIFLLIKHFFVSVKIFGLPFLGSSLISIYCFLYKLIALIEIASYLTIFLPKKPLINKDIIEFYKSLVIVFILFLNI